MLALTLEALSVNNPLNLPVKIRADYNGQLENIERVRDSYYPDASLVVSPEHIDAPSGTWNILNALKDGYDSGAELIFLVEEDVLIKPGYFQYHFHEQNRPEVLASCGRWTWFNDLHGPHYTNPGSCLKRSLLAEVISHMHDDYYTRLREYLREAFPVWDEMSDLDDGLIRRCVVKLGGICAFPSAAVCRHIGWVQYDRLAEYKNFETDIEKRITRLREIMTTLKPGDRYLRDYEF